jgi:hypothetical protein
MFSCQICSQRSKGNLFPLADPGTRARSDQDDIGRELPLFINPTTDDPETLLGFRAEIIYGFDPLGRREATREALDLNGQRIGSHGRERAKSEDLKALAAKIQAALRP